MVKLSILATAVVALVAPALAATIDHHALARRVTSNLQKRDARMTWYDITTGETACGAWYSNDDYVVAMNAPQYDSSNWCGVEISISYKGKTVKAKVVDRCESCPSGGLDLTKGTFSALDSLDSGIIEGDWEISK
ncbi:hypothetical protein PENSPDRAFT_735256 [Peniophora sp. CONT]|nr:hypothetical protein PENSPDRAFT_735256 [Peniophora sp. CONT]